MGTNRAVLTACAGDAEVCDSTPSVRSVHNALRRHSLASGDFWTISNLRDTSVQQ